MNRTPPSPRGESSSERWERGVFRERLHRRQRRTPRRRTNDRHRTSHSSSSRTLALGAPITRSIDPPLPKLHLVMDARKHGADLPQSSCGRRTARSGMTDGTVGCRSRLHLRRGGLPRTRPALETYASCIRGGNFEGISFDYVTAGSLAQIKGGSSCKFVASSPRVLLCCCRAHSP